MMPGTQEFWVSEPGGELGSSRLVLFKNVPAWFCAERLCPGFARPVLQLETHRHVLALAAKVSPLVKWQAEVFDYKIQA